jgi:lipid II:glycine glycyltransferase (peptidoglycan interpeptide bridge formation enzyme)
MITINVSNEPDEQWNKRLLSSQLGSIYHTCEYAQFVKHKGWSPKFLKFLDENDKIVGQLLVSTYSRFNKKKIISKVLKFIPNTKKEFCRWLYGPVIFRHDVQDEINLALQKFVKEKNYFVKGSEHPLSQNHLSQIKNSFQITKWGTFLIDLSNAKAKLWQNLDKHSARKNVERSEKRGVFVKQIINEKDLYEYYELLKETKNKVGWDIKFDEISFLWKTLQPVGFTGFLAKLGEKPVGGILVSYFNKHIFEWGIGRSEFDYSEKLYSQDLIKWKIIEWGKDNNCNYYDLSGINPNTRTEKESKIFRYKKKWGGKLVQYQMYNSKLRFGVW